MTGKPTSKIVGLPSEVSTTCLVRTNNMTGNTTSKMAKFYDCEYDLQDVYILLLGIQPPRWLDFMTGNTTSKMVRFYDWEYVLQDEYIIYFMIGNTTSMLVRFYDWEYDLQDG